MKEKANQNRNTAGIVSGNLQSAENFADNVPFNTPRGHGFAAEKVNHLYDKLVGKDAQLIGGDNAKNGADRLVDGVKIQTKFCNGGGKCISECFENGKFRYEGMKIEVPKDFVVSAKQAFEERVKRGEVVDISRMSKAEIDKLAKELADDTIKGSSFTYAQARNIAKFGTIESLTYDVVNGVKLAGTSLGITAVISFAQAIWSGENFDVAVKGALYSGLKVGGIAWISSIITAQVGRTATGQALRPATDWIVKQVGNKAAAIANTIRIGSKPIYGAAAANSASKLLRGNVVTGAVTVAVLSSVDFYKMFQGKVSGAQVFKNVTNTAVGVASGTACWAGVGGAVGAALGSVVPSVGTAIGGAVGGILGSIGGRWLGSKASSTVMDQLITDDTKEMQEILGKVFGELGEEYLLSQSEAENISENLSDNLSAKDLENMYKSSSRRSFARELIEPYIIAEVKKRKRILNKDLPTSADLANEIETLLEQESV